MTTNKDNTNKLSTEILLQSELESQNFDDQKTLTEEQIRFEKYGPLRTLLIMSVGPLIYQVGIALHDAIDLFEISKAFGEEEITIVGFGSVVRFICMSVAIFFSIGCVAKVSSMVGAGKFQEAGQVVADLYRISFASMLVVPVIFYFVAEYIMQFMGCSVEMSLRAKEYMIPVLSCMPFISFFIIFLEILVAK